MLCAGGPGTGTCWTATHESPTELAHNAQWRMATSLRLGATPDAGPRSTCALRKSSVGDMCEKSLATHPFHPFCYKYAHRAVQCTLRRLIEQAGGYAIDVNVRCPHAERYNESASKPGAATVAGEAEKTKRYGMAVRALVFETFKRLGGEGTKLLRDLVATAAANGQCSPHAVGRWRTQLERVMLTAQEDTHLRALGSRAAERPAAEPPLLLAEQSVYSSVLGCLQCDSHVKVRLTETETET